MSQNPIFPPGYLNALASDCFGPPRRHTDPRAEPVLMIEGIFSLAVFTGALATHLLWYGGKALLNRIRNHVSPPEPATAAAPQAPVSLRGVPTSEDIEDVWNLDPRTLTARLRIGSRLADLEPTLDSRFLFRKTRAGTRRIAARQPGLKGWMRKNVPSVKYSTAMHYKKLATASASSSASTRTFPLNGCSRTTKSRFPPSLPPTANPSPPSRPSSPACWPTTQSTRTSSAPSRTSSASCGW